MVWGESWQFLDSILNCISNKCQTSLVLISGMATKGRSNWSVQMLTLVWSAFSVSYSDTTTPPFIMIRLASILVSTVLAPRKSILHFCTYRVNVCMILTKTYFVFHAYTFLLQTLISNLRVLKGNLLFE